MVTAEKSIAIEAPIKKIFDVIADFKSYEEFLPEIESSEVKKETTKVKTVAFRMNLMQTINYTLDFALIKPNKITWKYVEGDEILKDNSGSWGLTELEPGIVDVNYKINVDFNIWLPSSVVESLLNDHLPKMLNHFKVRVENKN
ncbi:MAG: hypothetical protein HN337_02465 [Deltaproteobacteria bacterium]|jgi:coenzyme Q-binding protein COQ10|nr:hypothetical protein [Deltaproteobacteria bacterium]